MSAPHHAHSGLRDLDEAPALVIAEDASPPDRRQVGDAHSENVAASELREKGHRLPRRSCFGILPSYGDHAPRKEIEKGVAPQEKGTFPYSGNGVRPLHRGKNRIQQNRL